MTPDIREVNVARYYPSTVALAKEFQQLAAAENKEFQAAWSEIWKAFLNTFVYSLDKDGAARWEKMLKLYPSASDSLYTRKKAILAKINALIPYTERSFQEKLDSIYGKDNVSASLDYGEYRLWLEFVADFLYQHEAVKTLTRVIVPANLAVSISNTKKATGEVFIGCLPWVTSHTKIDASTDCGFEFREPSCAYKAGCVCVLKFITIRGE
jgi:hypothetical protein